MTCNLLIKTRTPWLITAAHRPMYVDSIDNTSTPNDQQVALLLRNTYEAAFVKYGVNLALWGHSHSYQRSCSVFNGVCGASTLPVHVVIGMAGKDLEKVLESNTPAWAVLINNQDYGYTKVSTTQHTLDFEFHSNKNGLVDRFILHQ